MFSHPKLVKLIKMSNFHGLNAVKLLSACKKIIKSVLIIKSQPIVNDLSITICPAMIYPLYVLEVSILFGQKVLLKFL